MRGRALFMDPPFDLKRAVDISDVIFKEKRKELVSICDVWRLRIFFFRKALCLMTTQLSVFICMLHVKMFFHCIRELSRVCISV